MSGPAIKYYTVVVPAKGAMTKLNEAGAAGHMLCHMERQPAEGTVRLLLAMPRQWDEEPWCPPGIQREIAKLRNAMDQAQDTMSDGVSSTRVRAWIEWIDEIMMPKPQEKDNADED